MNPNNNCLLGSENLATGTSSGYFGPTRSFSLSHAGGQLVNQPQLVSFSARRAADRAKVLAKSVLLCIRLGIRARRCAFCVLLIGTTTWSIATVSAQGFPFLIHVDFEQLGTVNGGPTYLVLINVPVSVSQLTLPDGSVLPGPGPTGATAPTFAAAANRFFGAWTFRENFSTYQFTLSPFTLSDVLSAPVQIVSPQGGTTLGTTFDVDWTYATSATPVGATAEFSNFVQR